VVQVSYVVVWYDTARYNHDILGAGFIQQRPYPGQENRVRAGQDADANYIHIFLDGHTNDLLRRASNARVDYFHPGFDQPPCHHPGAHVMPVKADLGNEYA